MTSANEPARFNPREAKAVVYRNSFGAFAEYAFGLLVPAREFFRGMATLAIVYLLNRIRTGEIKRAIINMPPRSGKSLWASVIFPAFLHGLDPTLRIVCVSYSADLAAAHARDYRRLITSAWFMDLFLKTRIDAAKNSEDEISLTAGGYRIATSIRGTLTGRGADLIIIDDSMRADDALSDAKRNTPIQWFKTTLLSRLDSKIDGAIIVVEQRQHEGDLSGELLKQECWEHLSLAAIAEGGEEIPIGPNQFHRRVQGEILNPDRESAETLAAQRAQMGALAYSAQYLQNPIPVKGNLIKWEWFKPFDELPPLLPADQIIQSWDPASTPGEKSDYCVCIAFARRGKRHYIIHVLRERMDYPTLRKRVISHREVWHADIVLMENSANGKALIDDIGAMHGVKNIIGVDVKDDKVTRMNACSAIIETGDVYLPKEAPWLGLFRAELMQFPGGAHDDQVDALSQYLNWDKKRQRRPSDIPVPPRLIRPQGGYGAADHGGPQFYTPKRQTD